ncbi:MAG: DUF1624 domain-containing protein [Dehalococcoidia bacterium]|nr:DUF1624 domain-containing protein [Dehalococcoidia bacterium]
MQRPDILRDTDTSAPSGALTERVKALDSLRGFAIASMVLLNLSAVLLNGLPPLPLRLVGSLAAAPVFVALSGFMVALTAPRHGFLYFLANRGLWILAVGAFVDLVVWRLYPFMSVEVLYLVGVSIPLAYLALKLGRWQRIGLIAALVGLGWLLRRLVGYSEFPLEYYIWGQQVFSLNAPPRLGALQHWLVDGWFPLFPWLAFAVLGAHLGESFRERQRAAFLGEPLLLGAALTISGAIAYAVAPPNSLPRGVWSELFYPPTVQFTILAMGVSTLLILIFLRWGGLRPASLLLRPLSVLGQASLGLYFLHLALIVYVGLRLTGGWSQLTLGQYALAYLALMLSLLALAQAYAFLRARQGRLLSVGLRAGVGGTLAAAALVLALAELLEGSAFAARLHQVVAYY